MREGERVQFRVSEASDGSWHLPCGRNQAPITGEGVLPKQRDVRSEHGHQVHTLWVMHLQENHQAEIVLHQSQNFVTCTTGDKLVTLNIMMTWNEKQLEFYLSSCWNLVVLLVLLPWGPAAVSLSLSAVLVHLVKELPRCWSLQVLHPKSKCLTHLNVFQKPIWWGVFW